MTINAYNGLVCSETHSAYNREQNIGMPTIRNQRNGRTIDGESKKLCRIYRTHSKSLGHNEVVYIIGASSCDNLKVSRNFKKKLKR